MATYYIDYVAGADTNNGTATGTAFQHCPGDANATDTAASTTLSANDIVVFRGGVVYYGYTYIDQSGSSGNEITFISGDRHDTPWGASAAIIDGSDIVSTWTLDAGNVWKATLAGEPDSVCFINTDTTISWGANEAVKGNLDTEYEWHWTGGELFVYSTTDPDSAYTSIHDLGAAGTYGFYIQDANYNVLDGLEVRFFYNQGIRCRDSDYVTMQNLTLHHCGDKDGEVGECVLIQASSNSVTDVTLKDSIIYEGGRHNIGVTSSGSLTSTNVLIQGNTIYNSYHNLVDIQASGTSQIIDMIIEKNIIYMTYDSSHGANGIFTLNYDTATFTDMIVRNNLVYNIESSGITISAATGIDILNNTVVNCDIYAIRADGVCSDVRIINNIGMDCEDACVDIPDKTVVTTMDYNYWHQSDDSGSSVFAAIDSTDYTNWATYLSSEAFDDNGADDDPLVVNKPTSYDVGVNLRLAGNSPCIDVGDDLSGDGFSDDYLGTSRSISIGWDIGAYEYTGGLVAVILV